MKQRAFRVSKIRDVMNGSFSFKFLITRETFNVAGKVESVNQVITTTNLIQINKKKLGNSFICLVMRLNSALVQFDTGRYNS